MPAGILDVWRCNAPSFKRLQPSGRPSAEYARVQALLQPQNFLIAFAAAEPLLCFQESGGCRPQRLISSSPVGLSNLCV